MDTKPKRRWYQFSLRTLLMFMTVAGVGLGWLGYTIRQSRQRREAVAAIKKLDGVVEYQQSPFGPTWLGKVVGDDFFETVVEVRLRDTQFSDADMDRLAALTELTRLYLRNTQVSDAGLINLKGLTQLAHLDLCYTQVTDAGMVHLRGLTQLEHLDLSYTQVSNAGLVHLKGLTQLKSLNLGQTRVSDAGLVNLAALTQLTDLDLYDTQVTDAGLVHLQGLTQLKTLDLYFCTKVTDVGFQELRKALPNLKIIWP